MCTIQCTCCIFIRFGTSALKYSSTEGPYLITCHIDGVNSKFLSDLTGCLALAGWWVGGATSDLCPRSPQQLFDITV